MPLVSAKLGEEEAFRLQTLLLAHTLVEASQVDAVRWLFHTPDVPPMAPPAGWAAFPQGDGNVGERLGRAFQGAFDEGATSVVAIDMECPAGTAPLLEHAFHLVEREGEEDRQVVLGPSERGGYYVIGLSRPFPELFHGVPWGTPRLFRTTLDRALAGGTTPQVLPRLTNIEDVPDWDRAANEGVLEGPRRRPRAR